MFLLDAKDNKVALNNPDYLFQVLNNSAAPFKFTYTSKDFSFVPANTTKKDQILLGKVFLRVNYYGATYGKLDTASLRTYILDRIYKSAN